MRFPDAAETAGKKRAAAAPLELDHLPGAVAQREKEAAVRAALPDFFNE